jgi:hypothetical protein
MTPGRYTELFFLDEATALAAGHRPCAECRRERFLAFCSAWKAGHPRDKSSQRPSAPQIDDQLHDERLTPERSKRIYHESIDDLPDGVFVILKESEKQAYLLWEGRLLAWSAAGYEERRPRPQGESVRVLTPKATVAAIRNRYVPEVHVSARGNTEASGISVPGPPT